MTVDQIEPGMMLTWKTIIGDHYYLVIGLSFGTAVDDYGSGALVMVVDNSGSVGTMFVNNHDITMGYITVINTTSPRLSI